MSRAIPDRQLARRAAERRWKRLRCTGLAVALVAATAILPGAAHGQESTLDAAETALAAGDLERARSALRTWLGSAEALGPGAATARARYLRARLSTDPDSSEADYLWVAVEGGSPYGPDARLRLAQLHLARGDASRAAQDLERLRADFPGSARVPESWLWTGRALAALGRPEEACDAWRRAEREARANAAADRELIATALETCRGAEAAPTGAFSVQLGAFRDRSAATELAARVRASDVEVRVVGPQDGLYRVRTDRLPARAEAERLARRLAARGFEAIVVPEDA